MSSVSLPSRRFGSPFFAGFTGATGSGLRADFMRPPRSPSRSVSSSARLRRRRAASRGGAPCVVRARPRRSAASALARLARRGGALRLRLRAASCSAAILRCASSSARRCSSSARERCSRASRSAIERRTASSRRRASSSLIAPARPSASGASRRLRRGGVARGAHRRRHAWARARRRGRRRAGPADRALLAHFDRHLLGAAVAEKLCRTVPALRGARQRQRLAAGRRSFCSLPSVMQSCSPILNSSSRVDRLKRPFRPPRRLIHSRSSVRAAQSQSDRAPGIGPRAWNDGAETREAADFRRPGQRQALLKQASVYHTFPPQRHAQFRRGKAPTPRPAGGPRALYGGSSAFRDPPRRRRRLRSAPAPALRGSRLRLGSPQSRSRRRGAPAPADRGSGAPAALRSDRPDRRGAVTWRLEAARERALLRAPASTLARRRAPRRRGPAAWPRHRASPRHPAPARTGSGRASGNTSLADDAAPLTAARPLGLVERRRRHARSSSSPSASRLLGSGGASIQPAAMRALRIKRVGCFLASARTLPARPARARARRSWFRTSRADRRR